MLFPDDAINVRTDLLGNSSFTLATIPANSTATILYESFNTADATKNGGLNIDCGPTRLLHINDFQNVPAVERFKQAKCNSDIIITTFGTTGSPTTTVSLIYVPYDVADMNTAQNQLSFLTLDILYLLLFLGIGYLTYKFLRPK